MAEHVSIFEVAPRDGLQNLARHIPTVQKIALVDALSTCGFDRIETASFVSPKKVPQMADASEVLVGITRKAGVRYAALTPNFQGFERAVVAGADEVAVFGAASEAFSQKNINCSISESFERFEPIFAAAKSANIPVRGYISTVTDCPYEGSIHPDQVARVAARLQALGCYEISLGDTIGHGTPETITAMLQAVLQVVPPNQLAGHYHDTNGRALDNITASLDLGLRTFDAAAGGLGGCPFAPGAKGNVATESVVALLEGAGFSTGIDTSALAGAATLAQQLSKGTL